MNNFTKKITITFLIFGGIYLFYKDFFYKEKYSIEEFGLNYNGFRKQNNIPLLPSNWILDSKLNNFHAPDMNQLGHRIKYINPLKSKLGAEMDKFYLTKDSILESRYERNTGNKLLYLYTNSNFNENLISSEQANLILKKYKIQFTFNRTWTWHSSLK